MHTHILDMVQWIGGGGVTPTACGVNCAPLKKKKEWYRCILTVCFLLVRLTGSPGGGVAWGAKGSACRHTYARTHTHTHTLVVGRVEPTEGRG